VPLSSGEDDIDVDEPGSIREAQMSDDTITKILISEYLKAKDSLEKLEKIQYFEYDSETYYSVPVNVIDTIKNKLEERALKSVAEYNSSKDGTGKNGADFVKGIEEALNILREEIDGYYKDKE
jgi:hypothetical protein